MGSRGRQHALKNVTTGFKQAKFGTSFCGLRHTTSEWRIGKADAKRVVFCIVGRRRNLGRLDAEPLVVVSNTETDDNQAKGEDA